MNALSFCRNTLINLDTCSSDQWAEVWVDRKMKFCRTFSGGRIFSCSHGIDFFQNVIDCLNGKEWKETDKDGKEVEMGKSFREMIKELRLTLQ